MTSQSLTDRSSHIFKKLKNPGYLQKRSLETYRVVTSPWRLLPSFLIIGTQKGGTTSLYNYLIQHPFVASAFAKEVHFFDNHTCAHNFGKGMAWYKSHFEYSLYKSYKKIVHQQDLITGEGSPDYLFDPHASRRIAATIPTVKLIVLLRNPVDRAYSHYLHNVRAAYDVGREMLSFEEAIAQESNRLNGEKQKLLKDETYFSYNYMHYSYLSRGMYAEQLKIWLSLFPQEQIIVLRSEDFFTDPDSIFKQVVDFLDIPTYKLEKYKSYNSRTENKNRINPVTRERLIEYFKPYNQQLEQLLGINFEWDN